MPETMIHSQVRSWLAGYLWLALPLLLLLGAVTARADEMRAVMEFSNPTIEAGEATELRLQVFGVRGRAQPVDLRAPGLDIQYLGASSSNSASFVNGRGSFVTSIIFTYQVTAEKAGVFTIPAVNIGADGKNVRAEAVALTVQKPGEPGAAPNRLDVRGSPEIVLSKNTAYVGEAIPTELRLVMDAQVRWDFNAPPDFDNDGFSKSKFPSPTKEHMTRGGASYGVGVFRSVITPSRAGKLSVGPVEFSYLAEVPRAQRNRPRGPLDDGFIEDFFNQGRGEVRQFKVKAPAVVLEVKPLPLAGQPKSFGGAVGKFDLAAQGTPRRVKVGDPLTMRLTVSGSGSFDRVSAPLLAETEGWRTYPATQVGKPDDEEGLRSERTYEIAVIPEKKQTHLPVFEFSYFDPETAKYVVLKTKAEPLEVEGEALPAPVAPVPATTASPEIAVKPTATPPPAPKPTDILGLRYEAGSPETLRPLYEKREFWWSQAVPLAGLLLWIVAHCWKGPNRTQQEISRLRKQRADLAAQLRRERGREAFYDTAARVLQYSAALRTGGNPAAMDDGTIRRVFPGPSAEAAVLEEIFEARARLLFAGGGSSGGKLAPEERERVLAAIEKMGRA